MFIFPVQLTTSRIGNLTRLIHTPAICVCVCVYLLNCTPRLQTALAMIGFKLNLDAVKFFPVSGHRRGKRADWRWMSVSKLQIRYAGGDERCGRRRVGLLNPLSGDTHKQDMYLDGWTKPKVGNGRFDLVWFRLSCDYGWIRSESINVR